MAFINSHKSIAVKSELDLFVCKPTQMSVESGFYQEYRPISVLDSDGPLEFVISANDDYIDLSHTQLKLRVKILREDGTPLNENDPVAPVNNFLHSLFEHLAIDLNNKTITTPSNSYHYRSYIETLLNYSHEAKKTHLTSSLFVKDEAGKMDDVKSKGFVERKSYIRNGIVELCGYIHSELMSQDKYLINGVNMRLKFYRSKAEFTLMTSEDDVNSYKIEILEAILLVRKATINPSVLIAHAKALTHANVRLPINRVDVKIITIPTDMQTKMLDNIYIGEYLLINYNKSVLSSLILTIVFLFPSSFLGQMPKRIIMAMTSASAVHNIKRNPYNFYHFDHNNVLLTSDSHTHIAPIKSDFSKGLYLQAFSSLFESCGIFFSDTGNDITRKDYPNGFALLGFDLSEDLSASENHLSLPRQGSLRIDIQFAKALAEPISIILFAEFDNIIEIDKDRNIILDYSS